MHDFHLRFLPFGFVILIVIGIIPTWASDGNLTERVASLEENLSLAERQLEVAMSRTSNLLRRIEELEHGMDQLEANLSRVMRFALPSPPPDFRVQSVGRDSDGNYSVVLRWRNNPEREAVQSYVVWFASKGFPYLPAATVNSSTGVMRTKIPGFIKDHEIVFKIFARNEAGQGEPSYREITIRGFAPYLMSRLRVVSLVLVLLVIFVVAWWKFPRGESTEDEVTS